MQSINRLTNFWTNYTTCDRGNKIIQPYKDPNFQRVWSSMVSAILVSQIFINPKYYMKTGYKNPM